MRVLELFGLRIGEAEITKNVAGAVDQFEIIVVHFGDL